MNPRKFIDQPTPETINAFLDALQDSDTLEDTEEHTGGSSSYYVIDIDFPGGAVDNYTAECLDIIKALDMTYEEGSVFKAVWRKAAARQGKKKKGNTALYDAEKIAFFGNSMIKQEKNK